MKVFAFFILFLFSVVFCFSQKKYKMIAEISNTSSLNIIPTFNLYSGTNISAGSQIETKKGNFNIMGTYQFSGNYWRGAVFSLQSHLLGIIFQYRILSNERKISPFVGISAITEVGTNYKDKYISRDLAPSIYPEEFSFFLCNIWQKIQQNHHENVRRVCVISLFLYRICIDFYLIS